jgi:hypothetical protein
MYDDVRTRRIKAWVIWVIVAFSIIGIEALFTNVILKEKTPFLVYAPNDMQIAFERVLVSSDLSSDYKVAMTIEEADADIIVVNDKENDDTYQKIAYSPYVVAYGYSYDIDLHESDIMQKTAKKEIYTINLSKLIDAVINEKSWKDLGVDIEGKIKVVYPDIENKYWDSFYNLMLIAANDGKYPAYSNEYNKAMAKVTSFLSSDNTISVLNMREKIELSGGFGFDVFYIGVEKELLDMSEYMSMFSLTETVSYNYYVKIDEISKKILPYRSKTITWDWDGSSFNRRLNNAYYRTEDIPLISEPSFVKNFNNSHNIVRIPKKSNIQIEQEG